MATALEQAGTIGPTKLSRLLGVSRSAVSYMTAAMSAAD